MLNSKVKLALTALRVCGDTYPPMGVALRMVEVQKTMGARLGSVDELNNDLIEKHGELQEGGNLGIGPTMDGWIEYVKEHNELMALECDLGDPFVLYQKDDKVGWTEGVEKPVEITPNVMVDMDDLLEIRRPETKEDATVAGNIG